MSDIKIICPKCWESNFSFDGRYYKCGTCGSLYTPQEMEALKARARKRLEEGSKKPIRKPEPSEEPIHHKSATIRRPAIPPEEPRPVLSSDGKHVLYGIYPQSVVTDYALIKKLDGFEVDDKEAWYICQGKYYAKVYCESYARHHFGNGIEMKLGDAAYWFLCEPIKWRILSRVGDEALVMSEYALDARRFNEAFRNTRGGAYPNNYAKSEIRSWLTQEFFPKAFRLGDSYVLKTRVDNSGGGVFNPNCPYLCADTDDKVFLLSLVEITNPDFGFEASSFASSPTRQVKPTDFALARGIYQNADGCCFWWLRSPSSDVSKPDVALYISVNGGMFYEQTLDSDDFAVRPAMRIKLR